MRTAPGPAVRGSPERRLLDGPDRRPEPSSRSPPAGDREGAAQARRAAQGDRLYAARPRGTTSRPASTIRRPWCSRTHPCTRRDTRSCGTPAGGSRGRAAPTSCSTGDRLRRSCASWGGRRRPGRRRRAGRAGGRRARGAGVRAARAQGRVRVRGLQNRPDAGDGAHGRAAHPHAQEPGHALSAAAADRAGRRDRPRLGARHGVGRPGAAGRRHYKDLWPSPLGRTASLRGAALENEKLLGSSRSARRDRTRPCKNMPLESRPTASLMRSGRHPPHPQRLSRLLTLARRCSGQCSRS